MFLFTHSSLEIAILTSSLFIILLYFILRNQIILLHLGYQLLGCFSIFTILRLMLPFELPITKTIYFPQFPSMIAQLFLHPFFQLGELKFSVLHVIGIIWVIGIVFFLIRYIRFRHRFFKLFIRHGKEIPHTEPYASILHNICQDFKIKKTIHLIHHPQISTPMVCWFHNFYILIPEDLTLEEDAIYWILRHEISHIRHFDLLLKFIMEIIRIVYWWNPFCHLLIEQTNLILEMRIDHSITINKSERVQYLECLLQIAKSIKTTSTLPVGIAFCSNNSHSSIYQRFSVLLNKEKPLPKKRLFIPVVLLSLYLCSFLFVFDFSYIPPEFFEYYQIPTPEDSYFINNKDGSYTLYYNDKILDTTNNLEYYPSNIKIYNSLEEVPN